MKDFNRAGSMVTNLGVALFAGALSSALILMATRGLSMENAIVSRAPVAQEQTEEFAERYNPLATGGQLVAEIEERTGVLRKSLLEDLQEALTAANEERERLAETVITLTKKIEKLEANAPIIRQGDSQEALNQIEEEPEESMIQEEDLDLGRRFLNKPGIEEQFSQMLAAGIDENAVRSLRARVSQYQLARLSLLDQASREGWANSRKLEKRLIQLRNPMSNLREELGNSAYDKYLYKTSYLNRVYISPVLRGSAAELVGLRVGDRLYSYAGEPVYQSKDLRNATKLGQSGEFVPLSDGRNGQQLSLEVERGPLDVTLQSANMGP